MRSVEICYQYETIPLKIFMFATELDSTRDHYRELDQFLFDMTRVIKRFEKSFGDRKA